MALSMLLSILQTPHPADVFVIADFEVVLDEGGCPLPLSQQHDLEDRKVTRSVEKATPAFGVVYY